MSSRASAEAGDLIRAARERAGLSQGELGRLLHVSQVCISHWENGRRDPGVTGLVRIAGALGTDAAALLPGTRAATGRGHLVAASEWLLKAPRIPARTGVAVVAEMALEELRKALRGSDGAACGLLCSACDRCDCACARRCTAMCHEDARQNGAHEREKAKAA